MVFYTLVISLFNLALGYFLALYLQSRGISPGSLLPDFLSQLNLPGSGRRDAPSSAAALDSAGSAGASSQIDSTPPALAEPAAHREEETVSAK